MDVMDNKLKRSIADPKKCLRRYGAEGAKKLRLRLEALEAAESLADFWPPYSGPERCHELKANLAGIYSMDAKHPLRLLLRSTENSDTSGDQDLTDGEQRWATIKSVELIGVEDTHD